MEYFIKQCLNRNKASRRFYIRDRSDIRFIKVLLKGTFTSFLFDIYTIKIILHYKTLLVTLRSDKQLIIKRKRIVLWKELNLGFRSASFLMLSYRVGIGKPLHLSKFQLLKNAATFKGLMRR